MPEPAVTERQLRLQPEEPGASDLGAPRSEAAVAGAALLREQVVQDLVQAEEAAQDREQPAVQGALLVAVAEVELPESEGKEALVQVEGVAQPEEHLFLAAGAELLTAAEEAAQD